MVVYPLNLENDVLNLLRDDQDEYRNYQNALEKSQEEFYQLTGVDRFYAIFNYGTNLVKLRDYSGAAKAYDQASSYMMHCRMKARSLPHLWYQNGPYLAYYYTGRYSDVIEKATLNAMRGAG